jgi:hypothetical protein
MMQPCRSNRWSSWVQKLLGLQRQSPLRRPATLTLEALEPRELPALNPLLALGAEAGRPPLVRVLDNQGTLIRSLPPTMLQSLAESRRP